MTRFLLGLRLPVGITALVFAGVGIGTAESAESALGQLAFVLIFLGTGIGLIVARSRHATT